MGKRPRLVIVSVLVVLMGALLGFVPVQAQNLSGQVTLTVEAGYDSYFRGEQWIPLRIEVRNNGPDIVGRLLVRPETSGSGLTGTYSTPISLAQGSDKTAFLYITARSFAQRIRVELIDDSFLVYGSADVTLRNIQPLDGLYMVVSNSPTGAIDLSGAVVGGYRAFQADWFVLEIPEKGASLDAIDLMVFSDVDTGSLSPLQAQAVADWVANGGHLIVTGGANWVATAAGLRDLLPLSPSGSRTIRDLTPMARLAGETTELSGDTVIATGQLAPDATVIAETGDGIPLVARHTYGAGTVDYFAADPAARPFRGWSGLSGLWFSLATSVNPTVTWNRGFNDWDEAINAIEILPGVNLLPEVLALCGFLALYIGLVGPVNYLILSRINRREWAWVTIPGLIIVFSAMAWVFGFNLRGNQVLLSRISVVQSWSDAGRARVDQLVGLLSPLRANYSLAVNDERLLRPISRTSSGGLFGGNPLQAGMEIRQSEIFEANNFPVDASFVASFNATGMIPKPAISGSVTLTFQDDGQLQQIQGSVRNDTEETLTDAVLLTRGVVFTINNPLEPGDIYTFQETIADPEESYPQPAALEPSFDLGTSVLGYRYASRINQGMTVGHLLGWETVQALDTNRPFIDATLEQEIRRRRFFLQSLMMDTFNSTARGDRVYFAAWTQESPVSFEVEGANWSTKDTTLYLIELELDFRRPPSTQDVFLSADKFTWVTQSRIGVVNYTGPLDLRLVPGDDVVFRFTPLPDMVLPQVNELVVNVDRNYGYTREVPIQVWNWQLGEWQDLNMENRQTVISRPRAYLGPQNAVQVRVYLEGAGGYLDVGNVWVEQRGRF
jgi:hypothetical protein